ncbi:CstA-like transporter-associated (seleno)protein [Uliginosibacterium sp. 31-16]|uniref:YbdD/YjiX family protein n=1 Tax=Uliginosibacterium sp. 31-16 TaxID=3068315 RepID=UPI00273E196D|nr:CstA-like transporter-associated (seleno)protein [Uliginosibacterium sp. 31-16]MDP5241051.1 CstA-like transporter-associated (seleno)protein [Uliginosibacterium sp. 31-16]
MFNDLAKLGKYLGETALLMVGQPDYDAYVQHTRLKHPDRTPMSYAEFFRNREDARFGGAVGKCC